MRYLYAFLFVLVSTVSVDARTEISMMEIVFSCSRPRCTIEKNPGGNPALFEIAAAEAIRKKVKVKITGMCASACVIFASKARKNVCVADGAKMMLHRGTRTDFYSTAGIGSRAESTYFTPDYGDDITAWALDEGKLPYDSLYTMTRPEMLRFWKACR